jgi:formate dehydrogenase maturation protein FdhE
VDDYDLNNEFPLGDGTVETSAEVVCPYCGETTAISVDPGGGSAQQYIEDCEVCCNPWQVTVRFVNGVANVQVTALDA